MTSIGRTGLEIVIMSNIYDAPEELTTKIYSVSLGVWRPGPTAYSAPDYLMVYTTLPFGRSFISFGGSLNVGTQHLNGDFDGRVFEYNPDPVAETWVLRPEMQTIPGAYGAAVWLD